MKHSLYTRHTAAPKRVSASVQVYPWTRLCLRHVGVTFFLASLFLLTACGDDDSFIPKVPELPGEVADMDELKEFECNDDLMGEKVYVRDLETDYECDGDHWFETIDTGKSSSSSKKTSSSSAKSSSSAESSPSGKSSSSETSVSSSAKSSSSYTIPLLSHCDIGTDENCFKDARDGQTYRTVKIGNQVWMRDNLNFRTGSSSCYNDDTSFCTKYGLLYTWATALDSVGEFSTNSKGCGYNAWSCRPVSPTYGICPDGWRIPSTIDWSILFGKVGGKDVAGKALKSASDWLNDGNGTDEASFTALPGGRFEEGIFYLIGNDASFWASNPNTTTYVKLVDYVAMSDDLDKAAYYQTEPYNKRYIRCIKIDTAQTASSSSITSKSSSSEYTPYDHQSDLFADSLNSGAYKKFTDVRNGRSYYYLTINAKDGDEDVSVTVMAENLNIGIDVPGTEDQSDDENIERYCYNDDTTNCDKYGGLYQWAEMMQLPSRCNVDACEDLIEENHRGICTEGWHVLTYDEYVIVLTANKEEKNIRAISFGGDNLTGYSLIGAGHNRNHQFADLDNMTFWFYPENGTMSEPSAFLGYQLKSSAGMDFTSSRKSYANSVRCVKD